MGLLGAGEWMECIDEVRIDGNEDLPIGVMVEGMHPCCDEFRKQSNEAEKQLETRPRLQLLKEMKQWASPLFSRMRDRFAPRPLARQ